jgi:DNA-binding SARP family transcriptional activator
MFGKFTVAYDGKEISLGRNTTLKCIQLLQIVWLSGDKGVTKEHLINALYERDKIANSNNSLNNLIYQMHQRTVRAGLPDESYIVRRGGVFLADKKIPIRLDVLEFEELIRSAEETENTKERATLYREALDLYQGELLPSLSTELWVMTESMNYKKMFARCVCWLGDYYKDREAYTDMYNVYMRAASIYPYEDWQVGQIDALIEKGELKQAYMLYTQTAQKYRDEMGVPLSDEMLGCYERMSEKSEQIPKDIGDIRKHLVENSDEEAVGAYYCSYPGFVDAYHVLERNMERSGQSIFLMLCTLVDYEGKIIPQQDKLSRRSDIMLDTIRACLRKGDIYTRYNRSQYLILLVGIKKEDCEIVYRRISQKLKETAGPRAGIQYSVSSLADPKTRETLQQKLKL